jgi:predicted nucleic acid-binding protein
MGSLLLLDTSALLTLRDDEPGAERVEQAFEQPDRDGRLAYEQLKALPLRWVEPSEPLLEQAGRIKACHSLSVADAWIAAAAQQLGATLLHKDPEFRAITELPQEWLG